MIETQAGGAVRVLECREGEPLRELPSADAPVQEGAVLWLDLVQLQLAQVQGRKTERLQQKVEVVASVLLVPTLVAGAYGANTDFPGLGERWGTTMMVLLMVLGAVGTFFGLRWVRLREERRLEREAREAGATPGPGG